MACGVLALLLASPAALVGQGSDAAWRVIEPGGETSCGFDTPFEFWVREGDPAAVFLYLQGGGACWSHGSCHPEETIRFDRAIDAADRRQRRGGIFDRAAGTNPFRDDTAVFVPYCTGDLHLGTGRKRYAAPAGSETGPVTVNHAGFHNVRAVLRYLASRPLEPRRITVTGGSAGAIASPVVAAEAARLFPDAVVRQVGDGVGGLRTERTRELLEGWSADSLLAARGMPLPDSGDALVGLYRAAAARNPGIRFSQVSTASDAVAAGWLEVFGEDPAALRSNIERTYRELRDAGLCFDGYAVPGTLHTILWRSEFLDAQIDGVPLPVRIERDVLDRPCPPRDGDRPPNGTARELAGVASAEPAGTASAELAAAATALLSALRPAQRERARFAFEDSVREAWSYIPRERAGLLLSRMTPEQRTRTHALLRTLLSHEGHLKLGTIMGLERYLQMVGRSPYVRDPEGYVIAVFGAPDPDGVWGFRFEGHHVSVSFTSAAGAVAATPFFLGANPAAVPTGPQAGVRALAPEADRARALLHSLSASQREAAVVSDSAPPDIVTGSASVASPLEPVGLRMSEMTAAQQAALLGLIRVYVRNLDRRIADRAWARVLELDPRTLRFAWFGGRAPGEPHYYRIQGVSLLIEYDHVSNHVHTVWRDLERDFGRDLLRAHRAQVPHTRDPGG